MPAISRVRITNIKYNKQQKVYDNLIFDLKTENKPLHTLISFVNSGGKGVLLQSLFQVLLPETSWGSNNENRVKHFFYNEKAQPAPYTMYIAIEWHLDDRTDSSLITGIAISGEALKNDVKQMDINYTLFTYVANALSPYQLETLPYYDKTHNKIWSLADWDGFLDSHKSFRKFSKSTKSKYYNHLKEDFGIYREDWLTMKEMNRKEAGITDYFEKGNNTTTNYGLFYHLIIPAIIENIESSIDVKEQKDLITLFKEMALIAKNLPILNQRETAYKDISEMNSIISAALGEVKQVKEKLDSTIYDSNVLGHLLENELNQMELDLKDWQVEHSKLLESKKDYKWQEVNLKYNKEYFKTLDLEKQLEDTKVLYAKSLSDQEQNKQKIEDIEIDILLKDYKKRVDLREITYKGIAQIESQQDFQDSKKRINEVAEAITKEWGSVYPAVNDRIYLFKQKIEDLSKKETQLNDEVEKWRNRLAESKANRTSLNGRIVSHDERLQKLSNEFRDFPQFEIKPKLVLEAHYDLLNELEGELEQLEKEMKLNSSEEKELIAESSGLSASIDGEKEKGTDVQKEYNRQVEKEKKIIEEVYRFSGSEADFESSLAWVKQQKEILNKQLKRLEDNVIPELQQQYWKMQFESHYSTSDFWIPNHEVAEIKRLIEEKGIQVLFGTDYLSSHDETERTSLNNKFPLLKYGLIVYGGDFDKIHSLSDVSDKTLYAPVPIYAANHLDKTEVTNYTLLNDQSTVLATNPGEWEVRKKRLSDDTEQYRLSIESQKTKRENLQKILNEIEATLERTSQDIQRELDEINKEITMKLEDLDQINTNHQKLIKTQEDLEKQSKMKKDKMEDLEKRVNTLEDWVERVAHNKDDVETLKSEERAYREAEYHLGIFKGKLEDLKGQKENWTITFKTWEINLKGKMDNYKVFNLNVVQPEGVELLLEDVSQSPSDDFVMFVQIDYHFTEWQNLQSEVNALNAQLAVFKERLRGEEASVQSVEDKLNKFKNWRLREVPPEPLVLLEQTRSTLVSEKEEIDCKVIEFDKKIGILKNDLVHIDNKKKEIKDAMDGLEVCKPIEIWENIDLAQKETDISIALENIKVDLEETSKTIKDLEVKQQEYKTNEKRLSDVIEESVKVAHIPKRLEHQLCESVSNAIDECLQEYRGNAKNYELMMKKMVFILQEQKRKMEEKEWDVHLKEDMLSTYHNINVTDLDEINGVIQNVNEYVLNERETMRAERDKGEKAKEDWVYNASQMVLAIVEALKRMKSSMTIVNKGNYKFPLIDFADYKLPKSIEDVQEPLKDFFEKKIKEVLNNYEDIEQVKLSELKKVIDNSKVTYAAFGQFPVLKIYNLNTDNTFLYAMKRAEYYTTWETMNISSETEAAGSGGQKVAARTLIAMMLLNYKRQHLLKGQWNVMISDNPFANAVSVHVIDPIIAVADALKIQWIVVAPPETIKAEVSVKFPVYYPLNFKRSSKGKDVVVQEVQLNIRKYTEQTTLF